MHVCLFSTCNSFSLIAASSTCNAIIDEGEWICKSCAKALGIKCGIEGHEWEVDEKVDDRSSSRDALVDSDDEEVTVCRNKRRKVLELLDSDSEDE